MLESLERDLATADTYEQWYKLATRHDRLTGADEWRRDDASRLYDHENIRLRLQQLRRLRRKGDDHGLLFVLNEGIHGNMEGMGKAQLYKRARCGTKKLIEDYITEISDALEHLAPRDFEGIPWAERIEFFQRASHCYGRSALMLSGGGTLGYFHLGVLKALIEQGLCPAVISGASAGAFVAAIVGTRTDEEFLALFEDNYLARALTSNPDNIKLGFGSKNRIDIEAVKREMQRLIPDMTFLEAYRKTGRSINITISPSSARQTSRLLNHIASPNVTVLSAVLASSALPGVFAPVQLEARNAAGEIRPYLPSRRWIDGSFSQDLPAKRLGRMYGINHFIVSQVMPGLGREPNQAVGMRQITRDAFVAATKEVVRGSLDWIQRRTSVGPRLGMALNTLNYPDRPAIRGRHQHLSRLRPVQPGHDPQDAERRRNGPPVQGRGTCHLAEDTRHRHDRPHRPHAGRHPARVRGERGALAARVATAACGAEAAAGSGAQCQGGMSIRAIAPGI